MANPNIVSVTSIYGESLGQALTTTVTAVVMTVSTHALVKINYIQVANDDASTATDVTVAITKADFTSAGVGGSDDILVILDKPIYLMEGDVLEGGADPATADIFISYEVIDDA